MRRTLLGLTAVALVLAWVPNWCALVGFYYSDVETSNTGIVVLRRC